MNGDEGMEEVAAIGRAASSLLCLTHFGASLLQLELAITWNDPLESPFGFPMAAMLRLNCFPHLQQLRVELLDPRDPTGRNRACGVPGLVLGDGVLRILDVQPWLEVEGEYGLDTIQTTLPPTLHSFGRMRPEHWYRTTSTGGLSSVCWLQKLAVRCKLSTKPMSLQFAAGAPLKRAFISQFVKDVTVNGGRSPVAIPITVLAFEVGDTVFNLAPLAPVRLATLIVTRLPTPAVATLAALTTVTSLDITGCDLRDPGWRALSVLSTLALTELRLGGCHLPQGALRVVALNTRLCVLQLSSNVDLVDMRPLGALAALTELSCSLRTSIYHIYRSCWLVVVMVSLLAPAVMAGTECQAVALLSSPCCPASLSFSSLIKKKTGFPR
jgi:hypothetical protein